MMQTEREYAEALFTLATEENEVGSYLTSLGTLKKLLEESPDYIEFLSSPAISLCERLEAIDEAFEGRLAQYVVNFLKVLCENGKSRMILSCIEEFENLARALSGRTVANIYSAVELSGSQKQAISEKITALIGKSIDPVYIIDESLIGGMKIEVDGKTFDGSIKHRLGDIKDVMNS